MVLQLFAMGADVRFIDGKGEFSAFSGFYPIRKIASDVEAVQNQRLKRRFSDCFGRTKEYVGGT